MEDKERIRHLVERGFFESMTEFHKIAAQRLLRDLEAYAEKKKMMKKKALEKPEDRIMKEMEELVKFADDLF